MHRLLILLAFLLPFSRAGAQQSGAALGAAAEQARAAWFAHDAAGLVAGSPRLVLQLPGSDPSTPLGPAQAAAL
ncbi:MAG TPA: hypothetical protein VFP28_04815, partial [Gemmatimonadales bacterium]|nr:hypothetical protein [Gemmatimonadales bacterium]